MQSDSSCLDILQLRVLLSPTSGATPLERPIGARRPCPPVLLRYLATGGLDLAAGDGRVQVEADTKVFTKQ